MGSLDEGANQEINDRQDDQDWGQSEFIQGTHPGPHLEKLVYKKG